MYHTDSEKYASLAEAASRQHQPEKAVGLYRKAAEAEARALADLGASKQRTLGITTVSLASLWIKAREMRRAQEVAHRGLASEKLPPFAVDQLRTLLQSIWNEEIREKAGIKFVKGEVLVSVSGGAVVFGGAPLELIQLKVDEVGRLIFRTIELLLKKPLRRRGLPDQEIRDQFRPWLFQAPAGSYQFAVRIERPLQMSMFPELAPDVDEITHKFLDIMQASVDDPEGRLKDIVPSEEYRDTFLKLTRNLAPTGKVFGRLEIRSGGEWEMNPIVLVPTARETINTTLRKGQSKQEEKEEQRVQVKGLLRGLQLDNDWLDVDVSGQDQKPIRIFQASDVIDDLVGPMVNHRVVVDAVLKGNRYYFRDIQAEE
jgi:hypothetical protein